MGQAEGTLRLLKIDLERRGYAPSTTKQYLRIVKLFLESLDDPETLVEEDFRRWFHLGSTPSLKRWRWLALKQLARLLIEEGALAGDPFRGIPMPKEAVRPQPTLSDTDFAALVATCGNDFAGKRDRAILLVLDATGCRRAELADLKVADINLDTATVLIRRGKGGMGRNAFLHDDALRAVASWQRVRARSAQSTALWTTSEGRKLTSDGIRQMIERRSQRAGVAASSHQFRRRYAVTWLLNGGSEVGLMSTAGWTTPAMPARYVAAATSVIAQAEHVRVFENRKRKKRRDFDPD